MWRVLRSRVTGRVVALATASTVLGGLGEQTFSSHRPFIVASDSYNHDREENEKALSTRNYTQVLSRNFVAEAADVVSPSVVNIVCSVGDGFLGGGASSGSGFIISKDGFIVTNAHVVAQSTDGRVLVTMWNSRKRQGVIHSMDKMSDIALVKLTDVGYDEDLPIAKFGVSGKLRAGEFVVALGSPLHLQNSVTFGIVSSTARHGSELGIAQNRTEYIQTDAAINVGNSGGPLVNLDGEVIGINSMKVKGSDGISFAIPIDTAAQVIKQLRSNKKVVRPYVGLRMANFIPETNRRANHRADPKQIIFSEEFKVVVVEVDRGSPAQRAGIQRYGRSFFHLSRFAITLFRPFEYHFLTIHLLNLCTWRLTPLTVAI